MIQFAFYGFATLSLVGAVAVLLTRNVLYAAFFLLLTLLGVAGLFVLASADFLAVAQIMIYVGGVLVLVIFGVMLTNKPQLLPEQGSQQPNRIDSPTRTNGVGWVLAILIVGSLFTALFMLIMRANFALFRQPVGWHSTITGVGKQLMTEYSLPFEMAGILLLAALVGATYLASPIAKSFADATRR